MEWSELPTPCYVVDEGKLEENLKVLNRLEQETGCRVLLAQKAFSLYRLYPLIGKYISGTAGSGLYEARLGHEEMGKENHVFAPAYRPGDMEQIVEICDHVVFNSWAQYRKHRETIAEKNAAGGHVSIGLRINPEYSTQKKSIYDPCAPGSRLGITFKEFIKGLDDLGTETRSDGARKLPEDVEGLHFHTLCEQNAEDLVTTFHATETKFGPYMEQVKWLNLGGGHHITREDYRLGMLKDLIRFIRTVYGTEVYLEPGEAAALNAGYLVTEVQDIVHNGLDIAILDASAACHMPDVLEMPYRPPLLGAGEPGEKGHTYRLSSVTCLAGDVIGDYSFNHKLHVGERLVFEDMAIYTMVKNNTFNGLPLPAIAVLAKDGSLSLIKEFGYEDFKQRLS